MPLKVAFMTFNPILNLLFLLQIISTSTSTKPNVLFIAIDDLRPQFGRSYHNTEVLAPNIDNFFLDNNGSSFQHAYVQIAVCGPSRASMLTGRRPDTTHTFRGEKGRPGTAGLNNKGAWCWCRRTNCGNNAENLTDLFYTLPQYFHKEGYLTAGVGKIFHPDACNNMVIDNPLGNSKFNHIVGDDPRAWSNGYSVEANFTQMQWGSIPGPHDQIFDGKMGLSFEVSNLSDEEQTDGILALNAIAKLKALNKVKENKPFFLAVGFHKPHLPHIVPLKYYEMYNIDDITLPPNPNVPKNFKEENWHSDGNFEMESYNENAGPEFTKQHFSFSNPIDANFTKQMRRAYFAATSFVDAQVGKVLDTLKELNLVEETIVIVWSDHGWHLGDTNSWCKMTTFETATRNTLLMRVPGQNIASQGFVTDINVESIDLFPTLIDLTGLTKLPKCLNRDDLPSVRCLQGESIASYFNEKKEKKDKKERKKYAFSQWPTPMWPKNTDTNHGFRMAYTVRSLEGIRVTEYVPYNSEKWIGNWTETGKPNDLELYDYNLDPWETINQYANDSYANVLKEMRDALKLQFS